MYSRTRPKQVQLSCLAVWFFCLLLSIPDWIYLEAQHDSRRGKSECTHIYTSSTLRLLSRVLYHVLGFLLPAIVLLYCYSRVLLRLQSGSQGVQKQRAVRVVLALVMAFFISWTPYNITLLVDTLYTNQSSNNTTCEATTALDIALTATSVLGYLHCCVNPVLYAFVGVKFRRHLLDLIKPFRYRLQTRVDTVSRKSSVWSADTSQTSAFWWSNTHCPEVNLDSSRGLKTTKYWEDLLADYSQENRVQKSSLIPYRVYIITIPNITLCCQIIFLKELTKN